MNLDSLTTTPSARSLKWDVAAGELPMWVADMDFEPPAAVRQALTQIAAQGPFGYANPQVGELGEALAGWYAGRHEVDLEPSWTLFAPGVNAALGSILRTITAPGEAVALLAPAYHHFFHTAKSNGRAVAASQMPCDGAAYQIDWADLEAKLAHGRTRAMIVCNPHNPTGQLWEADTLARLGGLADKHGVTVITDEVHGDLTDPGSQYTPWLRACGQASAIMVTSPSKPFNLAGLQCAALVVPDPNLRQRLAAGLRRDELSQPNVFAVAGAVAAYREGAAWLDQVRAYIAANRAFAEAELARLAPGAKPLAARSTYLLWIDCRPRVADSIAFGQRLRRATGLVVDPGALFGPGGEGFIRLNLAAPRARLADGVARLARALALEGAAPPAWESGQ
ncbi:MAG: aminotransferase class I/II-fold pyridoxal phosphate-dependent enzyme [Bifidobacteriaceae bacterium]|jgi:cystathionine beta-lyase|nr:aminotransferase class I/II-fold pyridoxal phosphate-dependent enzyme [Bifidobacteriaceae bacterium]